MRHTRTTPILRGIAAALCMAALAGVAGCSWQRAYLSGQAWQRDECQRLPDPTSRAHCLEGAGLSVDAYQRESEAIKAGR